MTEQEKEKQFKDKISELEKIISKLTEENEKISKELFIVKHGLNQESKEKERLLGIVENLSKGFSELGGLSG